MAPGASWEEWKDTPESHRHYVLQATSKTASSTHWHGVYLSALREKLAASGGRKFCVVIWNRDSGAFVLPVDWYVLNIANRARSEEGGRLVGHRHFPDRSFGAGTDPGRVRIPEEVIRPYFFATPAEAQSLLEDDAPLDPNLELTPPPSVPKLARAEPAPPLDAQAGSEEPEEPVVAEVKEIPTIPPSIARVNHADSLDKLLQPKFESLVSRAKQDAGIEQDAREVRQEYGPIFTPTGISDLDPVKFRTFLTHKGNRHWSFIHRHSGELTADLPLLKRALTLLVDETKPVSDRIDGARDIVRGLGKAAISAILQVAYPTEYGVYNDKSEKGLRKLGLHPEATVHRFGNLSTGKQYEYINRVLNGLSAKYGISLWALDTIWDGLTGTAAPGPSQSTRAEPSAWWVNQGTTYSAARDGGFLWAPKLGRDGRPRDHWLRLREPQPGDTVLHNVDGKIRAVSRVVRSAVDSTKPDSLTNDDWSSDGLQVQTKYRELQEPIVVAELPSTLRSPAAGPFTVTGGVKQGYLFEVSPSFLKELESSHPEVAERDAASPDERATPSPPSTTESPYVEPSWGSIVEQVRGSGLKFDDEILRRYHLSLKSRRIVILAGVSGTGKTSLALTYAKATGAARLLVPVAPNWTTNEDLLGYFNVLNGIYQDTDFSRFLREAERAFQRAVSQGVEARPYHVILDEMNLARVEYYFAKLLSAMEVTAKNGSRLVELGPNDHVELTPNVSVIGTINIDETTQGFSDKVYDRAQVVELPLRDEDIRAHLNGTPYADELVRVWEKVEAVAPFAYRVLDDIRAYVDHALVMGGTWESALDEQIVQKILPKLSRADSRVGQILTDLEVMFTSDKFPISREKTQHMLRGFNENGLASYF